LVFHVGQGLTFIDYKELVRRFAIAGKQGKTGKDSEGIPVPPAIFTRVSMARLIPVESFSGQRSSNFAAER
jgi:hypothetical protein